MKILNLFKVAFKAILLNKMRSFLTMLGIIIGVASVISMLAIGEGSKISIQNQISDMGSNMITIRPGAGMRAGVRLDFNSMKSLTMDDFNSLKNDSKYLIHTSPQVEGSGQVIYSSNNSRTSLIGVNPEYLFVRVLSLKDGSMFSEKDVKTAAKVVVIGQTVVENLFENEENPIGKIIRFNKIPFKVIGVLDEKGENTFGQDQDDIILAPYTTVQKRILAQTHLQSIVGSAKSEEDAPLAVDEITELMRLNHKIKNGQEDDFNVFSQQELLNTIGSTSKILTILLVAIAGISLLVGGIGIMNIMYVSIKERTKEIGLRMAIGGKAKDIMLQFLIEAIFISITGGFIGVVLGVGISVSIGSFLNWPISITAFSIIISFLVCVFTGVFFGWYPARKAALLDPIIALRYE